MRLTPDQIADILKGAFADAIIGVEADSPHPSVRVAPDRWHDVALFLRDDGRLRLNMLRCISGVDYLAEGQIEVVYDLLSLREPDGSSSLWSGENGIAVKLRVPRDDARVPSVAEVWPAANWHERETYDLLGVTFTGHPDHRRILCPDDWVGHPLRKDYQFPAEYHGIPGTVDYSRREPRKETMNSE